MKSLLFKSIFVLLLSVGLVQTSSAHCHARYYRRHCAPYYGYAYSYGPAVIVRPAPGYYYGPACAPGHWEITPWGRRIWVEPRCR
jgi:hypothetical protein